MPQRPGTWQSSFNGPFPLGTPLPEPTDDEDPDITTRRQLRMNVETLLPKMMAEYRKLRVRVLMMRCKPLRTHTATPPHRLTASRGAAFSTHASTPAGSTAAADARRTCVRIRNRPYYL